MDPTLLLSLAVGALGAAGALIITGELLPATPALPAALRRLHPDTGRTVAAGARGGPARRWARRWPVPHADLVLLGRDPAWYATVIATTAAGGAAVPMVAGVVLAVNGRWLPAAGATAGFGSVALAAGCVLVVHRDVAYRARRLRRDFRQVLAVYLTLVAMERGAGHGTVESLERASQVGSSRVMAQLRDALVRARTHHRPPWDELAALGERIAVPELSDLGQIMRGSGRSGAQVHRSLLERAASLRDQLRTDALARAEATTGRLEIPGAVLLLVLAGFVIYPITQRIYLGM